MAAIFFQQHIAKVVHIEIVQGGPPQTLRPNYLLQHAMSQNPPKWGFAPQVIIIIFIIIIIRAQIATVMGPTVPVPLGQRYLELPRMLISLECVFLNCDGSGSTAYVVAGQTNQFKAISYQKHQLQRHLRSVVAVWSCNQRKKREKRKQKGKKVLGSSPLSADHEMALGNKEHQRPFKQNERAESSSVRYRFNYAIWSTMDEEQSLNHIIILINYVHIAPFSLISQRPLSSEHGQSQQPNMLAYGRFFFKSLKIHFLFKRKAHPPDVRYHQLFHWSPHVSLTFESSPTVIFQNRLQARHCL